MYSQGSVELIRKNKHTERDQKIGENLYEFLTPSRLSMMHCSDTLSPTALTPIDRNSYLSLLASTRSSGQRDSNTTISSDYESPYSTIPPTAVSQLFKSPIVFKSQFMVHISMPAINCTILGH